MPRIAVRYRAAGPILVRASTHPDPAGTPDRPAPGDDGRVWLTDVWAHPGVRDAVSLASPDLAARVDHLTGGGTVDARAVRRAVATVAGYLLRWQRRATPFGLFAGITTATVGPAGAKIGDRHQPVARVDHECLTTIIDILEADHDLRRRLTVVADSTIVVRDGRAHVPVRAPIGARTPGPVRETSTRHTRPVQLALRHAAAPIGFDDLAARLHTAIPHVAPTTVDAMLHALVDGGFLITGLRPPMTCVDGLSHVIEQLRAAAVPHLAAAVGQLANLAAALACHNRTADPTATALLRANAAATLSRLSPDAPHPLAVDVHLDAKVTLPQQVVDDAALAADILTRLSAQPFGPMWWLEYHARFRDRYGPGALVPVHELLSDAGLGYPPGFLGGPRARPSWRILTERDTHLMKLVQAAILDGADDIALTDADVAALTVGDHTAAMPAPRVELCVAVHAPTADALDAGRFRIQVVGAPQTPTSMAGRVAYLLDPADRDHLTRTYMAGHDSDVLVVQVSFPPRRVHNGNVVRVAPTAPLVVPVGEIDPPHTDVVRVDDLAVTSDAEHLYLVHAPSGRRVVAHTGHALNLQVQTPPLARFLTEVGHARSAAFGPFDYGPAGRNLPYVPRIRYGRLILAPARWLLTRHDLPDPQHADWWTASLDRWRARWRVPARVVACVGELRLPLDLDQPADADQLRQQSAVNTIVELREDLSEASGGWVGRPAEFLFTLTTTPAAPRRLPTVSPPAAPLLPGESTIVHARLAVNPARADDLITGHFPALAAQLTTVGVRSWWFGRRRDTIRVDADHHLTLVLDMEDPAQFGAVATHLAEFVATLADRGLAADLTLAPYHRHHARYGYGPALRAAQRVFAADSVAAVAQLRAAAQAGVPAQAWAAASMARLAAGFAADAATGHRALLSCLQRVTAPAGRAVTDLARRLADPAQPLDLAGSDAISAAWATRDEALYAYRAALARQREPGGVLRSLLHEHHTRAVGVDPEFERTTNHAARAAAMRCLARTGGTP